MPLGAAPSHSGPCPLPIPSNPCIYGISADRHRRAPPSDCRIGTHRTRRSKEGQPDNEKANFFTFLYPYYYRAARPHPCSFRLDSFIPKSGAFALLSSSSLQAVPSSRLQLTSQSRWLKRLPAKSSNRSSQSSRPLFSAMPSLTGCPRSRLTGTRGYLAFPIQIQWLRVSNNCLSRASMSTPSVVNVTAACPSPTRSPSSSKSLSLRSSTSRPRPSAG